MMESKCRCGKTFIVDHNIGDYFRKDGKRVYEKGDNRENVCSFRCSKCHRPVHESVPGAEFVKV